MYAVCLSKPYRQTHKPAVAKAVEFAMKNGLNKSFADDLTLLRAPFGFKVVKLKKEFKMISLGVSRNVVAEKYVGRVIVFGCNQ